MTHEEELQKISVKLPVSMVEEIDTRVQQEKIRDGRVNRSDIIRNALKAGLPRLEATA